MLEALFECSDSVQLKCTLENSGKHSRLQGTDTFHPFPAIFFTRIPFHRGRLCHAFLISDCIPFSTVGTVFEPSAPG